MEWKGNEEGGLRLYSKHRGRQDWQGGLAGLPQGEGRDTQTGKDTRFRSVSKEGILVLYPRGEAKYRVL